MWNISHSGRFAPLFALALTFAFTFSLGVAHAQDGTMYSWTDEDGVVHFSDRKPEGREAQAQALPESPRPGSVSPELSTDGQPSVAEQRREELVRKQEEYKTRQEVTAEECAAWRSELERLEPNRRVFYTNDQGETVRMDDVVRTNRVAELHQFIDEHCK